MHGIEGLLAIVDDRYDETRALQGQAGDELDVKVILGKDDGHTAADFGGASCAGASCEGSSATEVARPMSTTARQDRRQRDAYRPGVTFGFNSTDNTLTVPEGPHKATARAAGGGCRPR